MKNGPRVVGMLRVGGNRANVVRLYYLHSGVGGKWTARKLVGDARGKLRKRVGCGRVLGVALDGRAVIAVDAHSQPVFAFRSFGSRGQLHQQIALFHERPPGVRGRGIFADNVAQRAKPVEQCFNSGSSALASADCPGASG